MSDAKKDKSKTETPESQEPAEATTAAAPEAPLTPKQIEELKTKASKADEHWERLLRTTADLDNFKKRAPADSLKAGIGMIYNQMKSAMTDAGLEEIDATGQPFDPNLHEAVSQQDSPDIPEGTVIQQLRKGYRFRERLLRPATVIVSRKSSH